MVMASATRFPYQRLRQEGSLGEQAEEDERTLKRIRNFSRFRGFNINRRRLKLKIPGLRKFSRTRTRFLSRVRVSWSKALKRLKNGQAHMNDLYGGNFLVMQVGPAPFMYGEKPRLAHISHPSPR